jgi:DNA-binding response OmpR family regulator
MSRKHQVLIVEDDKATVDDLVEVLHSIGCECRAVASYQEALQALRQASFCLILLDLQIKYTPDAIKGHVEHGKALLREIRRMYGEHSGLPYWLPVLVVSGFANEVPTAVEVMKDGASDVIQKPLDSRIVSDRIRGALRASGREVHDRCHERPEEHLTPKGLVIEIPGEGIGRRTVVTIGGKRVELTNASLKVLLQLMVGHQKRELVHKRDLGAKAEQGFKGISILRHELKSALGTTNIIKNDHHGNYRLEAGIKIGPYAVEKLVELGDKTISELAKLLRHKKPSRSKKV